MQNYTTHFTPQRGWMNDPNGLVYVNGVYHLFYQHYPQDIVWGPMHWGHAVSTDLIHWEHKEIALFPTETEYIFSGSCVYDAENVSGLGTKECPPLIALYTGHNPVTREEQQCVAYSTDFETFQKYAGNPVIGNLKKTEGTRLNGNEEKNARDSIAENTGFKKDFRDPKVFLNTVKGGFSLVVAAGPKLEFYYSANLLSWDKTGEFDPGVHGFSGICECPDCFPVETEEGTKWILTVSMILPEEKVGLAPEDRGFLNSNVMQYFVGKFDGETFTDTQCAEVPLILDYGLDNYAMVSFLHSKEPLLLGWGENWDYVSQTPAVTYRGKMTMARKAKLVNTGQGWRLRFEPAGEVEVLQKCVPNAETELQEENSARGYFWKGMIPEGEKFRVPLGDKKELVIEVTEEEIIIDRRRAGNMSFSEWLARSGTRLTAKRMLQGDCPIIVVKDQGYFEIFAEDGLVVFSVMTY